MPNLGWWLAGGAGLLILASSSSTKREALGFSVRERDVDALARMLTVEHPTAQPREKAQIVWVALNRARRHEVPPELVVLPGKRSSRVGVQGPTWNNGAEYRRKYADAHNHPRYAESRAFVREVLAGKHENERFSAFIHPRGMPSPPCTDPKHVVTDTFAGPRCVPKWGADPRREQIGKGYFYV